LETRGVKSSSYYQADHFDVLPADTEPEDLFDAQSTVPIVTQTGECDEDVSLPPFSSQMSSLGLEADEAQDLAESTFNSFSRDVLGNSSAVVSDDSDAPQGESTPVITGRMRVVSDEEQEEQGEPDPEIVTLPTIEFKPWSGNGTWPQALGLIVVRDRNVWRFNRNSGG
jgi:hypothetical protein